MDEKLRALVAVAELSEIQFQEISASRRQEHAPHTQRDEPSFFLKVQLAETETGLSLRIGLRLEVELDEASVTVEPVAVFLVPSEHAELTDPVTVNSYVNEVAVMVLAPYLRQALADITGRVVGEPLMMPILERGQLNFPLPDAEEIHTDSGAGNSLGQ